jgi:hypothetical protein
MSKIIKFEANGDAYDRCCNRLWDLLMSFTDEDILRNSGMTEESLLISCLINALSFIIVHYYDSQETKTKMIGLIVRSLVNWTDEREEEMLNDG